MQSLSLPAGTKGRAGCSPAISNLLPVLKIKDFPCASQMYLVFALRFPALLSSRLLIILSFIFFSSGLPFCHVSLQDCP